MERYFTDTRFSMERKGEWGGGKESSPFTGKLGHQWAQLGRIWRQWRGKDGKAISKVIRIQMIQGFTEQIETTQQHLENKSVSMQIQVPTYYSQPPVSLTALHHFTQGTWTSMDFGIRGGSWNQLSQPAEDGNRLNFEPRKAVTVSMFWLTYLLLSRMSSPPFRWLIPAHLWRLRWRKISSESFSEQEPWSLPLLFSLHSLCSYGTSETS